jgi:molybdopterin converting factor subunit 1
MNLRVKLFAAARDAAGTAEVALDVPPQATLADVEEAIRRQTPGLVKILPHARWAVNREFAVPDAVVTEESEIALIPPVSGG